MNSRTPDTEPLDEDEQSLARIVRALPAGEPPSALDARILKSASDALATPTRRRAVWLGSGGALWGIGSAAAAVLAIGIAWQKMNPTPMSLPATSPVPVAADLRDDGRTEVEFKTEAPRRYDNSPPPPSAPALAESRQLKALPKSIVSNQPASAAAAAPAPAAFPQDAAKESLDEHVADAIGRSNAEPVVSGGAPAPRAEAQAAAAPAADANVAAMAKAASAERDQSSLGTIAATVARIADQKALYPESTLYPESWLAKIRARMKHGDTDGARASLRLFMAKYPDQQVPDDLKTLLRE